MLRRTAVGISVAGLAGLTAALADPARLYAQDSIPWPRADKLSATVQVRVTATRGDTVRVSYALTVGGSSVQPANLFVLRSDVHPTSVSGPVGWYASSGVIEDSGEVDWSSLAGRADVRPGATERGFEAEAVGLLDIITYRVQGRHAAPVVTDSTEGLIQAPPSVWVNSVGGSTVGFVAVPSDNSAGALMPRLESLIRQSCSLGWIRSREVCRALGGKLQEAARDLADGRAREASKDLREFVQQLREWHPWEGERQHEERGIRGGRPEQVNDAAYWLLRVNAEYILARL
ncbi:MAG TPA: hypothetical protein VMT21_00135 [Gemmatimonadales bacterium]|nr:hypothetical protein [Gemmatimonadales bacterium]